MKWIKYCKLVLIIGSWRKNVDFSSSPLGCARRNCSKYLALEVLSVWWKTSISEGVLFLMVLPQFSMLSKAINITLKLNTSFIVISLILFFPYMSMLLPSFQIIRFLLFCRYIIFTMYLDIVCI